MKEYYYANPGKKREDNDKYLARNRAWYARIRARCIEIYGGSCVACGSTDRLELDHINDDGFEHRSVEHQMLMYARIAREGDRITDYDLQLLCRPCHAARRRGVPRNRRAA